MKRSGSYKFRQLPHCEWCFTEVPKASIKFCTLACAVAANNWKAQNHWNKIGTHVEGGRAIVGEEDYEYLVEKDNANDNMD